MANKNITFEAALAELEGVVEKLDNGELALDEAIAEYERACALVSLCEKKLSDARKRVNSIIENKDGIKTVPFDIDTDEA